MINETLEQLKIKPIPKKPQQFQVLIQIPSEGVRPNIIDKTGEQLINREQFFDELQENLGVVQKDYEKMKENAVIPLNIYQTWHTKNLPTKMQENVNCLKRQNPEFKYYLYDDYDCREFIKKNFDKDVLNAFDTLIPGAYKADLWRYCILYKNGGIYLDINFKCEDSPPFIFSDTWESAASTCKSLLEHPEILIQKQKHILKWWNTRMEKIKSKISEVLNKFIFSL
jgi:mannosyltransferase OCH1-like enzyme